MSAFVRLYFFLQIAMSERYMLLCMYLVSLLGMRVNWHWAQKHFELNFSDLFDANWDDNLPMLVTHGKGMVL